MMRLDFLEAANGTPLAKQYTKMETGYHISPYPNEVLLNSTTREDITDLETMEVYLKHHAALGHCLLKGNLSKQLSNESRAGHTDRTAKTEWIVLDLDMNEGFDSPQSAAATIAPELGNAAYIFHDSSSAGITGPRGLRGHLYFILDKSASPEAIKQWLIHKNLTVPALRERLTLSANGMTLKYPLDISVCDNSKILYIAPPVCMGFQDPIEQRFQLMQYAYSKPTATLDLDINAERNRLMVDELVAELRTNAELPVRKPKTKIVGGEEILMNPDRVTITDITEARGFYYFNFNGGNSLGYYTSMARPEIVYNFKGELPVRLVDISPSVYAQLNRTEVQVAKKAATIQPIVFREMETDSYYNALYDNANDEILSIATVASKDKIEDFYAQYGYDAPEIVHDWKLEFRPDIRNAINLEDKWVNLFMPTQLLRGTKANNTSAIPPVIDKILSHVLVDKETKNHWLNWIAVICQHGVKTGTAWLLQGTHGTGKGLLYSKILQPIFGVHGHHINADRLDDQFNEFLALNLLLFVDEMNIHDLPNRGKIENKLKSMITEPFIMIRGMRKNPRQRNLYSNCVFATNNHSALTLDDNDRRMNIAPRQELPLVITQQEVDKIHEELTPFMEHLLAYPADINAARKPLMNEARNTMIALSKTSIDLFFDALKTGDLGYLSSFVLSHTPLMPDANYMEYERFIKRAAASVGAEINFARDELMAVFAFTQNTKPSPTKFSRMCAHHGLDIKPVRIEGKLLRGIPITFRATAEEIRDLTTPKLTTIKGGRSAENN